MNRLSVRLRLPRQPTSTERAARDRHEPRLSRGQRVKARSCLCRDMLEGGEDMENRQALGYALLAMKYLGYSKEEAKKVVDEMVYFFDVLTPEEAEEVGFEWYEGK